MHAPLSSLGHLTDLDLYDNRLGTTDGLADLPVLR